jgi:hypothetical protein
MDCGVDVADAEIPEAEGALEDLFRWLVGTASSVDKARGLLLLGVDQARDPPELEGLPLKLRKIPRQTCASGLMSF